VRKAEGSHHHFIGARAVDLLSMTGLVQRFRSAQPAAASISTRFLPQHTNR